MFRTVEHESTLFPDIMCFNVELEISECFRYVLNDKFLLIKRLASSLGASKLVFITDNISDAEVSNKKTS